MMPRLTPHSLLRTIWLLTVAGLTCLSACSRGEPSGHRKLLTGLPDDMIHHLVFSDDSTFAAYGREAGFVVLSDATREINRRIKRAYIEGHDEDGEILLGYCKRIARVVSHDFDYPLYLNQIEFIENFPLPRRREVLKLESDFYAFRSELDRPAAEKFDVYARMLDQFTADHDVLFMGCVEYELSYVHKSLGDNVQQLGHLRRANAYFAECGLHEMTVATLGELGLHFETTGDIDSMIVCYEKASTIADKSRLPLEAAYITSLYAHYYTRQGRLALAYDLIVDAMETCRTYKGEYFELKYIAETITFQADLGCWDIVEKLVRRARVLQSAYHGNTRGYFKLYSAQIDRAEGRMMLARGDVRGAETLLRRAKKTLDGLDMPDTRAPETASLYTGWARGLLENGDAAAAADVADKGLRLAGDADLYDNAARCALLVARAALRMNDAPAAQSAIATFDSLAGLAGTPLDREWISRDALLGFLHLQTGHPRAARRSLETGLDRIRRVACSRDASTQSYLWIDECNDVRRLMHELTSDDARTGYGAELWWHDLYRLLGRGASNGTAVAGTKDAAVTGFTARAESVRRRLAHLDAIHCLYVIHDDEVRRWTVSSQTVEYETLATSAAVLRDLVDDACRMMVSSEPEASSPAAVHQNLRALARVLLPPRLRDASAEQAGPIFITADGFLRRLPFEALDVGAGERYVPLLLHRDVAYLRHAGEPTAGESTTPGVIVAGDTPSPELRTRYPFQRDLPGALAEAESIAAARGSDYLLVGESATKSNLQSRWEKAPFIYVAAHTLRDPQVPYLQLIPLAVPTGAHPPDVQYLDFSDVRHADFRRCHLVVLSGCSTGAPYVEGTITGPSLADAFIDAGAGAVIQTFWDVRDDHARRLMTSLVPGWQGSVISTVRALCAARRDVIRRSDVTDFSRWAPFSIEVGRI